MELAGIPTVIVAPRAYEVHLCAAFTMFGLPSQPTVPHYFPAALFRPESNLKPFEQNAETLFRGLTSWNFALRQAGLDISL